MKLIERLPEAEQFRLSSQRKESLQLYLRNEIEAALSNLWPQHRMWQECLRLYKTRPKQKTRSFPIENAPNFVVPLAATAADVLYSRSVDLLFSISPTITVRAAHEAFVDHAKALQRLTNFVADRELKLRQEAEPFQLDVVQMGTGVYYIPFIEAMKKTRTHRVIRRHPRVFSIPPEDFIVPGGATHDLETLPWVAWRREPNESEFRHLAEVRGWHNAGRARVGGGASAVRTARERFGHTGRGGEEDQELFEIYEIYVHFDIDGDGLLEDLFVVWDRTSGEILHHSFNPFDRRPFSVGRFQPMAHLFFGEGVISQLKAIQDQVSEEHNYYMLNRLLSNTRLWVASHEVPENLRIWPNRVIRGGNIDNLLKPLQMGDTYTSAFLAEQFLMGLAERRVGISEMTTPRPSQVLGSRTPGITALTLTQQANSRFAGFFHNSRTAAADAVRQGLYRMQERLLGGDQALRDHIVDVLGQEEAALAMEVMEDDRFDESVSVELTASDASVNREADKQNAIVLTDLLIRYYQGVLGLVQLASAPETPEPVRDTAKKIASKSMEIMDRTIRTFDQVRDPQTFLVDANEELDQMDGLSQPGLQGLGSLLGLAGGAEGAVPAGPETGNGAA